MRNRKRISLFAVLAVATLQAHHVVSASSDKTNNLYLVKKIYLPLQTEHELPTEQIAPRKAWLSQLKEELARVGFSIVENSTEADAVLMDTHTEWVTLDGPQPDPPKYSYEFELVSPDKRRLWKTAFDIRSRLSVEEVGRTAARRMARDLCRDWLKSARRAGISDARNCE